MSKNVYILHRKCIENVLKFENSAKTNRLGNASFFFLFLFGLFLSPVIIPPSVKRYTIVYWYFPWCFRVPADGQMTQTGRGMADF